MAIKIKPRNMFDFYVPPGGGAKIANSFSEGMKPSANLITAAAPSQSASANTTNSSSYVPPGNVNSSDSKGIPTFVKVIIGVAIGIVVVKAIKYISKTYFPPKVEDKVKETLE